jgi:hypothetical protein
VIEAEDEILNIPLNGRAKVAIPSISSRNFASCPLAGIVAVPVATGEPPASDVNSNVTAAGLDDGFAMAKPVLIELGASDTSA